MNRYNKLLLCIILSILDTFSEYQQHYAEPTRNISFAICICRNENFEYVHIFQLAEWGICIEYIASKASEKLLAFNQPSLIFFLTIKLQSKSTSNKKHALCCTYLYMRQNALAHSRLSHNCQPNDMPRLPLALMFSSHTCTHASHIHSVYEPPPPCVYIVANKNQQLARYTRRKQLWKHTQTSSRSDNNNSISTRCRWVRQIRFLKAHTQALAL